MPTRTYFDASLIATLSDWSTQLAAVAAFTPNTYAGIAEYTKFSRDGRCGIASGRLDNLGEDVSTAVKKWIAVHHVRSGSESRYLAVLPRDEYIYMKAKDQDRLLEQLIQEVDGVADSMSSDKDVSEDATVSPTDQDIGFKAFWRVPVLPQIYEILVYAHRDHDSAIETLQAVTEAGFVRLSRFLAQTRSQH